MSSGAALTMWLDEEEEKKGGALMSREHHTASALVLPQGRVTLYKWIHFVYRKKKFEIK